MSRGISAFDVIEAAHAYRKVSGALANTYEDSGYRAVAIAPDKVTITYNGAPVRVEIIGMDLRGVIRSVRFDSNKRAIYEIDLDNLDTWVARQEEIKLL